MFVIPRLPAPVHLPYLALALPLALSLTLLFDLVEGQDVFPLLAGGLAVAALGALEEKITRHDCPEMPRSRDPLRAEFYPAFEDTYRNREM